MLVNSRQDDTLVTLLNHTSDDWEGDIIFNRENHPAVAQVRDLIQDRDYPAHLVKFQPETVQVTVRVPAFEVKVLAFGPERTRQPFKGPQVNIQGYSEDDKNFLQEIIKKGPKAVIGTVE
jgi:hypothetical protein